MDSFLNRRAVLVLVGAILAWRLFLAASLELHPDEAYYWLLSRHLQGGYYDHPPLVAFLIRLTTLWRSSEFTVRLASTPLLIATLALTWRLAMNLFRDERVASASVLLLVSYPIVFAGSLVMTPDIPSFFFWAVGAVLLWELAASRRPSCWYLLGAALGFGLLAKYTGILLAPCVLIFLLATGEWRWLKTIHPWLGLALALALFAPVILWNQAHQWVSFRFQLHHGLGGSGLSLDRFLEFLGGQALVFGPIAFGLGLFATWGALREGSREGRFLAALSLPVLGFFGYAALRAHTEANWTVPVALTLAITTARYGVGRQRSRPAVLLAAIGFNLILGLVTTLQARFGVLPLAAWSEDWARKDVTNAFHGWRQLAEATRGVDGEFIVTPSHTLGATLSFYRHGELFPYVDVPRTRMSQINLWGFPTELRSAKGLYVGEVPAGSKPPLDGTQVIIRNQGVPVRTYTIQPLRGQDVLRAPRS